MTPNVSLICEKCGCSYPITSLHSSCQKCSGTLEYIWDKNYLKKIVFTGELSFWRYKMVLPVVSHQLSLGEGGTPLQKAQRLSDYLGLKELYLKDETRNPTNSYKDRVAALIVSDALGKGFSSLVSATNGNQGASLAAYSAKADLECHLVVPQHMDFGKLAQMMAYDAHIIESGDNIEDSIEKAVILEKEMSWYQATTELNPLSLEAIKTISYEIIEQRGLPDWVVLAMGSGVTTASLWKGFKELKCAGKIDSLPKLIGVQAEGCAPISQAFKSGSNEVIPTKKSDTEAIAISVMNPIYGNLALDAIKESDGLAVTVTDTEMLQSGREIARLEGIFPEPASASTVACLDLLKRTSAIDANDRIICIITSSGLKTDDILQSISKRRKSLGLGSMLTTKEKILRLFSNEDTYGYEIWKSLGKGMTIGAVYQHISDLEKRGLITSNLKGKRRYFQITDRGRKALEAMDVLQALL